MLKLLLIVPLLGCLPLIFIKDNSAQGGLSQQSEGNAKTNSLMKNIALGTSLINLFISIIL
jgi:hypothetical protein